MTSDKSLGESKEKSYRLSAEKLLSNSKKTTNPDTRVNKGTQAKSVNSSRGTVVTIELSFRFNTLKRRPQRNQRLLIWVFWRRNGLRVPQRKIKTFLLSLKSQNRCLQKLVLKRRAKNLWTKWARSNTARLNVLKFSSPKFQSICERTLADKYLQSTSWP